MVTFWLTPTLPPKVTSFMDSRPTRFSESLKIGKFDLKSAQFQNFSSKFQYLLASPGPGSWEAWRPFWGPLIPKTDFTKTTLAPTRVVQGPHMGYRRIADLQESDMGLKNRKSLHFRGSQGSQRGLSLDFARRRWAGNAGLRPPYAPQAVFAKIQN